MRQIIIVLTITMLVSLLSGCSRSRNCCDECYGAGQYRELWDRHDCRYRHGDMMMPDEFYDARDFHPDSIYGDPHGWRDGDRSRLDDGCRYHDGSRHRKPYHRHHRYGYYRGHDEDALPEQYLPPLAPDMEFDE
jgi:hypothetical protein